MPLTKYHQDARSLKLDLKPRASVRAAAVRQILIVDDTAGEPCRTRVCFLTVWWRRRNIATKLLAIRRLDALLHCNGGVLLVLINHANIATRCHAPRDEGVALLEGRLERIRRA